MGWAGKRSLIAELGLSGVSMDCEAGMFCAKAPSEVPLKTLGARMAELFHDLDALRDALDSAPMSG